MMDDDKMCILNSTYLASKFSFDVKKKCGCTSSHPRWTMPNFVRFVTGVFPSKLIEKLQHHFVPNEVNYSILIQYLTRRQVGASQVIVYPTISRRLILHIQWSQLRGGGVLQRRNLNNGAATLPFNGNLADIEHHSTTKYTGETYAERRCNYKVCWL